MYNMIVFFCMHVITKPSFLNAPVVLNFFNLLQKINKMFGKHHILSLFLNLFNKYTNT